ncbi:MAG: hypothetical protein ACRC62_20320 [Microcoleus sp.]
MPVTTYLEPEHQVQQPLVLYTLTTSLYDLKKATGKKWLIREEKVVTRNFFLRKKIRCQYQILVNTGCSEYQIITLYKEDVRQRTKFWYSADAIAAYIAGYLAGIEESCLTQQ